MPLSAWFRATSEFSRDAHHVNLVALGRTARVVRGEFADVHVHTLEPVPWCSPKRGTVDRHIAQLFQAVSAASWQQVHGVTCQGDQLSEPRTLGVVALSRGRRESGRTQ